MQLSADHETTKKMEREQREKDEEKVKLREKGLHCYVNENNICYFALKPT